MKNKVQLITYPDRLSRYNSGEGIKQLTQLLTGPLEGLFDGGIHLLPFFHSIHGSDAGYDPIDHRTVDPTLGNWEDVRKLSDHYDLMVDLIVNHISSRSPEFQDVLARKEQSPYYPLFLQYKDFFNESNQHEIAKIYRPRPGLPFSEKTFQDGSKAKFWTTFTSEQMDINVLHPVGARYLNDLLDIFAANGIRLIRLDAVGYAIKKIGASCFMIDESYQFIDQFAESAKSRGMEVLVEIHSYYRHQMEIASKVDYVYDFALPPLVLHTLFSGNAMALKKWLQMSPRNCITVLDTHDGIGVIDIGPSGDLPGLIADEEVDALVETIHKNSNHQSREATGASASNLDLYQVNCTYYDALGRNDQHYLMARAIQFFSPGTPQVYYVGLLAGENDMELLKKSGAGRDINRHYYTTEEVLTSLNKPVVQDLITLIKFRNQCSAFDGALEILPGNDHALSLKWTNHRKWAHLEINFPTQELKIRHGDGSDINELKLSCF